jgi:hypothetical protein
MTDWNGEWLIGSRGVYRGRPGAAWRRVGSHEYGISSLIRQPNRLVAGAASGSGLWEWLVPEQVWRQLHDETLTEVLTVAAIEGDPGVVAGAPFGLAVARRDACGAARWTSLSEALRVTERYTNAIMVDPVSPARWLVGSEAGVLIFHSHDGRWERTSLTGTPVRALAFMDGIYRAGTDDRGIWKSCDGLRWDPDGHTPDGGAVYQIVGQGEHLMAATQHGVAVGDGRGRWFRSGPRMLFAALAAHPDEPSLWLAGGTPGGLWYTENNGGTWRQIPGFSHVRAILAPDREQG